MLRCCRTFCCYVSSCKPKRVPFTRQSIPAHLFNSACLCLSMCLCNYTGLLCIADNQTLSVCLLAHVLVYVCVCECNDIAFACTASSVHGYVITYAPSSPLPFKSTSRVLFSSLSVSLLLHSLARSFSLLAYSLWTFAETLRCYWYWY